MRSEKQRFLEKVIKLPRGGCWLWGGNRTPKEYGLFATLRKQGWRPELAHRSAWRLYRGKIPSGACVCHQCDNPICVKPSHLYLADNSTNMRHKIEKGRQRTRAWMNEVVKVSPEHRRLIEEWKSQSVKRRFWAKVRKTPGCWLWKAGQTVNGYGKYSPSRLKTVMAHRFSYEMAFGEIPDGKLVCHHCDTPLCVNPEHLFVGTSADNMQDKVSKGRQAKGETISSRQPSVKGAANANSRLTKEKVDEIRALYASGSESYETLAQRFAVTRGMIAHIIKRRNWAD